MGELFIPTLHTFAMNNIFTGSMGLFRFRAKPEVVMATLTKPFSPSELVARVKAHLARYERLIGTGVQENDIVDIRGIKIDKTARRVWVNGEEKNFTTKEFDLLTFLAQNPNRVFTKDELFREI